MSHMVFYFILNTEFNAYFCIGKHNVLRCMYINKYICDVGRKSIAESEHYCVKGKKEKKIIWPSK